MTGNVPTVGAGTTPGLGLATFLLGDVSNFNRYVSTSTNAQERQKRIFWYGQDEWRPTPKLTVTLGLRWEMIFPETVNAAGNGATLNLNNGLMYVFGVGGVPNYGIQQMNWSTFAPRAGIAYQLGSKTVIRAGYGWSYDLGTFGSTFGHNVTQNPPVLSQQQLNPSTAFGNVFNLAQGPSSPPATPVGSNGTFPLPNGINVKFRPPHDDSTDGVSIQSDDPARTNEPRLGLGGIRGERGPAQFHRNGPDGESERANISARRLEHEFGPALLRSIRMDARSLVLLRVLERGIQFAASDGESERLGRMDAAGELYLPAPVRRRVGLRSQLLFSLRISRGWTGV